MEIFKKLRDGLMGVEYESEEEDYEYEEEYEDERGHSYGEQMGAFARLNRGEYEEDRSSKSKKKKERAAAQEPVRSKRSSRDYDYDHYDEPRSQTGSRRLSESSKVVPLNTGYSGSSSRVVIFSPETLEDARPVCESLKNSVICVINLERLDKAVAQRIADFLSGACDALNGTIQRISHDIFLIAPQNVAITAQVKEELKNSGLILPWVQAALK